MADIIMNLATLKSKADAVGVGTTATSSTPSLCPTKSAIPGYLSGGSAVVSISGSYANNLLVATKDVTVFCPYVDLGLPSGTKWAKWNLGVTDGNEVSTGNFYYWGNTTGYTKALNHAFTASEYSNTPGRGLTTDIPANATYDAARANWGGSWRLPTVSQFQELFFELYDYRSWTLISGVWGWKVSAKNGSGNYIFFPCGGHCGPSGWFLDANYYTFYMSSNLSNTNEFYGLGLLSSIFAWTGSEVKYSGNLVRPVC